MATNKNQHYVPRSYLRQFSSDEERKCLNVYNIDRDKLIINAPLKHQCSKDYFYGKDDSLEEMLKPFESGIPKLVKRIENSADKFEDQDKIFLKSFWLLQYLRTNGANQKLAEMSHALDDMAGKTNALRFELDEAVQSAMRLLPELNSSIADLKCCLVKNNSAIPFITSDDPSILTNRWMLTKARHRSNSFGLSRSGAIIILPLTPSILFLGYDGDVYTVNHKNGWVKTNSERDVEALNQHQYLNCCANIFIKNTQDIETTRIHYNSIKNSRISPRFSLEYCTLVEVKSNGQEIYKPADPSKLQEMRNAIVKSSPLFCTPSLWPSLLRWNPVGHVYTDGTEQSYIRRARALVQEGEGMKKIRI